MAPREGHFHAAQRVLGYLKKFPKGRLIIDPVLPDWSSLDTNPSHNWSELYPDAVEDMPPNMPTPLGTNVRITCYVDTDHGHDQLTRHSVTGILVTINNTPIKWMSKRQKTVESSTYGSELVAARIATECII
jgi:hypothetical protein